VGEWLCRELQCPAQGRAARRRDLLHGAELSAYPATPARNHKRVAWSSKTRNGPDAKTRHSERGNVHVLGHLGRSSRPFFCVLRSLPCPTITSTGISGASASATKLAWSSPTMTRRQHADAAFSGDRHYEGTRSCRSFRTARRASARSPEDLGVSSRTLSRRLAAKGVTFAQ
jgi:hypothetical protein